MLLCLVGLSTLEAEVTHARQGQVNVLILGLGASGLAMGPWCALAGADVTVADTRDAPPQLATLQAEWPAVHFVSGPFAASLVEGTSVRAVFRSPGLAPEVVGPGGSTPGGMGLWQGASLSLFAAGLQDLKARFGYAPQVLAITRTNGKTTVTSLTGQLVARAGKTVKVAGNIGPTLLDTLTEAIAQAQAQVEQEAANAPLLSWKIQIWSVSSQRSQRPQKRSRLYKLKMSRKRGHPHRRGYWRA